MGHELMRVLVATDGSLAGGSAVDMVANIRWPEGTTVRVVEAVETGRDVFGGPWPTIALVQAEKLEADLWQAAVGDVEQARARLARPELDVSVEVLRGRPASAIVDAARSWNADCIVLGSRGHGTIESMVLGSVSAEVVDHAQVPVLVARDRSIDRVVLAWDGSACARVAADLLKRWPIFAGSSIRVVSVADVGIPWWSGFPTPGTAETIPMYLEAAEASRRVHGSLCTEMSDELRAVGLEAAPELRDGDPATEVIAAAQATDADLIVLGTHGRTGMTRLVLGSVARNVLHHATCSVLIVRERPSDG
jgi:nucleotide-binding universal stress UspA family protein